jgi:hypothetical protein
LARKPRDVPRISTFYGIAIYMYHHDHGPAHVHAIHGDFEALIDIRSGLVLAGGLPPPALALVRKWVSLHRDELAANWSLARMGMPLRTIHPLA